MEDHSITARGDQGPLPADDPGRRLVVSAPEDTDARVVSLVGDTYTILVSGKDGVVLPVGIHVPRRASLPIATAQLILSAISNTSTFIATCIRPNGMKVGRSSSHPNAGLM